MAITATSIPSPLPGQTPLLQSNLDLLIPAFVQTLGTNIRTPVWKAKQADASRMSSLMDLLQAFILTGLIVAQASSSTTQDLAKTPLLGGNFSSARESHPLNVGLESGPSGQAWVHTHWYQQNPSEAKSEPKRRRRFLRPSTDHAREWLQMQRQRYWSNRVRGKRSSVSDGFRERRHARFGGRAGLGLHWARDQFGHKLVLDR